MSEVVKDFAIDEEFRAYCRPLNDEEFRQLESNILEHGCRDSLVVWNEDGLLLDGHNRHEICTAAGLTFGVQYVSLPDREAAIDWIIANQLGRRNLSPNEFAYYRGLQYNREKAVQGGDRGNQHTVAKDQIDPLPSATTADRLAERHNVSPATIKRNGKFAEAANLFDVETKSEILSGEHKPADVVVAKGDKEILAAAKKIRQDKADARRKERTAKIDEIAKGNAPIDTSLDRKFPVIYVDPPWRYEHSQTVSREIENHYPTMDLGEICALPVSDIAADDAIMFMWTTSPKLAESLEVVDAWGFSYRTCFVWVKDKIGMGYYARQRHEILLVAKRGEIPVPQPAFRFDSVIEEPRTEHSSKPDVVYEMIEKMYPEFDKIELFSRQQRQGWESWGNQS